MNKVIVIGKLSKAPNLEYTALGTPVCTLSIETEEEFQNAKKETKTRKEWIRAVVFGKRAEICNQELKIDSAVYAEGKLQTRSWDHLDYKKYITEVLVSHIEFLNLEPKPKAAPGPMDLDFYTNENVKWNDDEIPF